MTNENAVIARMLDAALPWVSGRRLETRGLSTEATLALQRWSNPGADDTAIVALGSVPDEKSDVLVLLLPGVTEAPVISGMERIEVQYAYTLRDGVADDTGPATLGADHHWPYAHAAAGVWLDERRPAEVLGMFAVYRRDGKPD
ncbi:MAG: hypothetical protein IPK87_11280 [Planctomycetes bacterium]|nr:hypothetical protein [Planctomycetota bacterium]